MLLLLLLPLVALASKLRYNETFTREIALPFAAASYCDPDILRNWTCAVCTHTGGAYPVTPISGRLGAHGYVAYARQWKMLVVSFKGVSTDDFKTWYNSLFHASLTPYTAHGAPTGAKVHEGFLEAYTSVSATVVNVTRNYLANPSLAIERVLITGHSMGAVMSTFVLLDVLPLLPATVSLTWQTFGAPRAGNPTFASFVNAFNVSGARVVHHRDLVAHAPWRDMGYHHVATEVYYNASKMHGNARVCDGSGEDPTCSDGLTWAESIDDHEYYFDMRVGESCTTAAARGATAGTPTAGRSPPRNLAQRSGRT